MDLKSSDSYSLALSETGDVYSWGRGHLGHLGTGDEQSRVEPYKIVFDFKDEKKKIKKVKRKATG